MGYKDMTIFDGANWGPLERDLRDDLASGQTWPVSRHILIALTELGMSDTTIGSYFGVDTAEVANLRYDYKISDKLPSQAEV